MATDIKDKLRSLAIDRTAPEPGRGKMWALAGVAAVAGVAFIVSQIIGTPSPAQASIAAAPSPAQPAAVSQPIPHGMVASGYVVARHAATVSADITGRLTTVQFEEGASVKEGQLLAELDDGPARYDLDLAQARLQSAQATLQAVEVDLAEGQAQLHRAQQLSKTATISPAALEAVKTRIQSLNARHDAAFADVRVAQVAVERQADFVERHKIRAPFAGVIIAKNAQSGEILSSSTSGGGFARTGIATLVDMASLEVEVDVNEGQIARIVKGQKASVVLDAYPDLMIPGQVLAVIPTADRDRATIQVRVGFERLDPKILPQMSAKVTFEKAGG